MATKSDYNRIYWKKNRDRILRKRRERYMNDEDYRRKVIQRALKNYFDRKMQKINKEVKNEE